ncbi:hypothetical protein Poli38472_003383 [Pythium oligandrum]|uniref:4'-phosphopantetheinyl transferase domain-containing protein n=1 Tax=Pythium oligandrum TaxID=41045 RepID=A0A8K1C732_PYTOL|nr:hypothetical protein Poli38472_003383 [Pythium oligandrum]|eukprot:TMW57458.1 hypothetical protein Poli38472_003383 [Pythium oligandrum]
MRIYGVGTDVARVSRFQQSYERFGDRFLRKAFHPKEIEEFYARPAVSRAHFLASRWAVKEATYKAFQRYRVLFPEIHVGRHAVLADDTVAKQIQTTLPIATELKSLELLFSGETAALANQLGLVDSHVSLSHDEDYAVAFVILQQREPSR